MLRQTNAQRRALTVPNVRRLGVSLHNRLNSGTHWINREAANGSPSPGGEGRGEGGQSIIAQIRSTLSCANGKPFMPGCRGSLSVCQQKPAGQLIQTELQRQKWQPRRRQ